MTDSATDQEPRCPQCQGRLKRWAWPCSVVALWCLNPGAALLELVLAVRIPRVMLVCDRCKGDIGSRSYIPCPHCGSLHLSKLWTMTCGFGHWFGYVCPNCYDIIPLVMNFWSLLLLAVLSPFWYLPAKWARPYWLNIERLRIAVRTKHSPPCLDPIPWLRVGAMIIGGQFWFTGTVIVVIAAAVERNWSLLSWGLPGLLPICVGLGLLWAVVARRMLDHSRPEPNEVPHASS
jgi:hypothetical protein